MVINIVEIIIGLLCTKYLIQSIENGFPWIVRSVRIFLKRRKAVKVNNKRLERMILNAKRRSDNEEGKD